MLGAPISLVRLPLLFGSIARYLVWGSGTLLAVAAIVAIVVWRGRKSWPVLAAIRKHPFAKYVVASIVAHLVLVVWLLNSSLFSPPSDPGPPPVMVTFDGGPSFGPRQQSLEIASVVPAVNPPPQEMTTQPTEEAIERPALPMPSPASDVPNELPVSELSEATAISSIQATHPLFAPRAVVERPNPRSQTQTTPFDRMEATEEPKATGQPDPDLVTSPEDLRRHQGVAEPAEPRIANTSPLEHAPNDSFIHRFTAQAAAANVNAKPPKETSNPPGSFNDVRRQDDEAMADSAALANTNLPRNLDTESATTMSASLSRPAAPAFSQIDNQQHQASDEQQPTRRLRDTSMQRRQPETSPRFSSASESVQTATLQDIRAIEDARSSEPYPAPNQTATSTDRSEVLQGHVDRDENTLATNALATRLDESQQGRTKLVSSAKSSGNIGGVPPLYHDRLAANRLAIAQARGGSINTERAVKAALDWLASAQAANGGWDASQFGGGRPTFEGGHDRRGAGRNADAGITGLAVLAFLGAGETHKTGDYANSVHRALHYLLSIQHRDGSLSGNAQVYAAMYCHGIATLAISEAYSLTGDPNLLPALENAVRHTLSMQHPSTGGWRYRDWRRYPGQEGDTSQLGWQLMALTSAHYAGLQVPGEAWLGANRFLDGVTSRDGRASYRPRQLPSPAMTAEAMLCRLFLRVPPSDPQIQSAARYLLSRLPGQGRTNYYYWYYGTLALYHLQDDNWQRWNTAVKRTLVGRQQGDGSWSADSVWGTSGGKVYSTALGALTLEVYYRYRPLTKPNSTTPTLATPIDKTANQFAPREERGAEHTAWKRN